MTDSKQHSHSDDEVLVRVEGVSKKFCRSLKRSLWYGICDIGAELNPFAKQGAGPPARRAYGSERSREYGAKGTAEVASDAPAAAARDEDLREGEFYAVRDVSFELRRGECLGLIGHNGAGKTTLLKMLNGLIKPDTGRIEMNGRVGALIALGAGFNPILTGRENIYINGAVLGLSKKEIDEKINDIIDFAEIREFIDMPVQSYSSGMAVRLGFSVASSLNPDVLILDEVLAVGDMKFVVKCLNRLREIASQACVILVSHNMQFISGFCTRVLMMGEGEVIADANEPSRAIGYYYDLAERTVSIAGDGGARVLRCEVLGATDDDSAIINGETRIPQGAQGAVSLEFELSSQSGGAVLQLNVADQTGFPVMAVPVFEACGAAKVYSPGIHSVTIPLGVLDLNAGVYSCTVILRSPPNDKVLTRTEGMGAFRVLADLTYGARIVRPAMADHG